MRVIVGVALGGALGASARYGLDRPIDHRSGMGVVGGYTTFSTFAQESLDLVDARDLAEAILYVGGSVVLGMIAVYLGRSLGRSL